MMEEGLEIIGTRCRLSHGSMGKWSLEAQTVIEQSGFQNELHQTSNRVQQAPAADRLYGNTRLHNLRPSRRALRSRGRRSRSGRLTQQAQRLAIRLPR